jgi:hypothetical protein
MMEPNGEVLKRDFRRAVAQTTSLLGLFQHRFEGSLDGDTQALLIQLRAALNPVHDRLIELAQAPPTAVAD